MSLLSLLRQSVRSWRRRRTGARKLSSRPTVSMECLDHRQLLAANFTGNVINDFPLATTPAVKEILPDFTNPATSEASFSNANLQNLIQVSGFYISGVRLAYTQADDTLSIGLETPANPKASGQFVLASDADNNGNSGVEGGDPTAPPSVDPAVQTAAGGGFSDFADLGGTEYTGVFLDLSGQGGVPQIVAGIGTGPSKLYQVAQAVNISGVTGRPDTNFGKSLPQFTGRIFINNDPTTPNIEMTIVNFSALYQQVTGQTFSQLSNISVGAYGGSANDNATETTLPVQTINAGSFFTPTPVCPPPTPSPLTPPVLVNYHENNHLNTAHTTTVRVQVFGTAQLNVDSIVESSVHIGGASPLFSFDRKVGNYPFPTRTFVFRGTDINLPPGLTPVDVTGTLTDGRAFDSTYVVFNRNDSFYSNRAIDARNARLEARGLTIPLDGVTNGSTPAVATRAIKVDYGMHASQASHSAKVTETVFHPGNTNPIPAPAHAAAATAKVRVAKVRVGTRMADLKATAATTSTAGGS